MSWELSRTVVDVIVLFFSSVVCILTHPTRCVIETAIEEVFSSLSLIVVLFLNLVQVRIFRN